MPPVPAVELSTGLGFNVDPANPWELQMAKDAGAIEVRMQPSWSSVENMSGQLALPAVFKSSLSSMASLGLQPLLVAAYGPPYASLGTVTLSSAASTGQSVLHLQPSAVLSQAKPNQDLILEPNKTQIVAVGHWSYGGALIAGITSNTLTLASPLTVNLSQGAQLQINHVAYPPAGDTTADPSVKAYVRYVTFLADQVASYGLTGRVEIWNEPKWTHDPWDGGIACYYSSPPSGTSCHSPNMAFARALFDVTPPASVRFNWGGTHKTGSRSLIAGANSPIGMVPTKAQILGSVSSESFHPYGPTPETHAWDPACLTASTTTASNLFKNCTLSGENTGSNVKLEAFFSAQHLASDGWTIERNITELGIDTANDAARTRYLLRAYLTYHAMGMRRVNFYRLADGAANTQNYGIVDKTTRKPFPAYNAIKAFMGDVGSLSGAALPVQSKDLPSVASYEGKSTWPLMVVPIVGRPDASAAGNTVLLALWQRTYLTGNVTAFENITSPPAAVVDVHIPAALHLSGAWSLADRSPVTPYCGSTSSDIKVLVADDPVVVEFEPN